MDGKRTPATNRRLWHDIPKVSDDEDMADDRSSDAYKAIAISRWYRRLAP